MLKVKISASHASRERVAREFLRLHSLAKSTRLRLVESYGEADIILVTDTHHRNLYADVLSRPEHREYYAKLLGYFEFEFPPDKIPGIYTCSTIAARGTRGAPFYFWLQAHDISGYQADDSSPELLFSFMGRNCNKVRSDILNLAVSDPDVAFLVEDTTNSFPLFNPVKKLDDVAIQSQRQRYFDVLARSKFALAPKGAGPSSIRQYEAMAFGSVPVILSDTLKNPYCIDWKKCSVRIPESEVDTIPDVLKSLEPQYPEMSVAARQSYEKLMNPVSFWHYIEDAIIDIYEKDFERREPIGSLKRAIGMRAVRRTLYRRKNDLKRLVARLR